jgi:hypothetical protein
MTIDQVIESKVHHRPHDEAEGLPFNAQEEAGAAVNGQDACEVRLRRVHAGDKEEARALAGTLDDQLGLVVVGSVS